MNHLLDVLRWEIQTYRVERKTYHKKNGTLSPLHVWGLFFPNLRRPIFVIGAPRSGTTFLGRCLAYLPEVSYHNEPAVMTGAAPWIYEGAWSFWQAYLVYRQTYSWLMRMHLNGHLRFSEKTPLNCFFIPFLQRAFPDAQFVHIIRDGRDAALSYSKKIWLQAAAANSDQRHLTGFRFGPYARFWVEPERRRGFESTSDIHRCIWAWRRHVSGALAGSRNLPSSQYFELRYETLVTSPRGEAERLLDYLGITCPESRRQFGEAASQAQTNSVGLGEKELTPEQLAQIEQEAGPLLRQLGYI